MGSPLATQGDTVNVAQRISAGRLAASGMAGAFPHPRVIVASLPITPPRSVAPVVAASPGGMPARASAAAALLHNRHMRAAVFLVVHLDPVQPLE